MEGPHRVPVKKPEKAIRCKVGSNGKKSFPILWLRLELYPSLTGQFHLGAQTQQPIFFHILDPPEIERLARPDLVGMTPAAPQPHPADSFVEPAAHAPCPIHVQPAAFAANPHVRTKNILRGKVEQPLARLDEHA